MKRIMLVYGTRPEAIKMAPLQKELEKSDFFEVITCVTAQHRQILDQVLEVFDIIPDIDLNLMSKDQDLYDVTSKVLISMRQVLSDYKPDLVLVHGDTTTTMASALAAFYMNIDVGHVEAGLRTHNIYSPFPEEINRQIVSRLVKWHFAPTDKNKNDLISEGINEDHIVVTGNTVIDAMYLNFENMSISGTLDHIHDLISQELAFSWQTEDYILITAHRRENIGDSFDRIFNAIKDLAIAFKNIYFVYPVHPNPKVRDLAYSLLKDLENVYLINPMGYQPFCVLMANCYLVMTDSGGIQEEAPSLGKPVLVLRDNTERPEAVESGTAKLVGSSRSEIVASVSDLILNSDSYRSMSESVNPYGDGTASKRIIQFLKERL